MITEGETISAKWFLPTFTQHHAPGIPQIGDDSARDANFALLKLRRALRGEMECLIYTKKNGFYLEIFCLSRERIEHIKSCLSYY